MPKNRLDKWADLIEETARFLITESPASEKAKSLGLIHKGYGYYADPHSGLIVARSVNGGQDLIRIDRSGPYDSNKHHINKKKSYEAAVEMARTALSKEMLHLLDFTGLDSEVEPGDDAYKQLSKLVIQAVESGQAPTPYDAANAIEGYGRGAVSTKGKLISKYLNYLIDNPGSASYAAIKGYTDAKKKAQEPEEEPQQKNTTKTDPEAFLADLTTEIADAMGLTNQTDRAAVGNKITALAKDPSYDNAHALQQVIGMDHYKKVVQALTGVGIIQVSGGQVKSTLTNFNKSTKPQSPSTHPTPDVYHIGHQAYTVTGKLNHFGEPIYDKLKDGDTVKGTDGNYYMWDSSLGDGYGGWVKKNEPAQPQKDANWETAVNTAREFNSLSSETMMQLAHALKAVLDDPYAYDTNNSLYNLVASFSHDPKAVYAQLMQTMGIKPLIQFSPPEEPIEPDANTAGGDEEGPKFSPADAFKAMGLPLGKSENPAIFDALEKLANAKKAHDVYNSKKALTALGVTPEQWKKLLKYLKAHHQAMQTNPYYQKGKGQIKIGGKKGQIKTGGKKGPKGKQQSLETPPSSDEIIQGALNKFGVNLKDTEAANIIQKALNAPNYAAALDIANQLSNEISGILPVWITNQIAKKFYPSEEPTTNQPPVPSTPSQQVAQDIFNSIHATKYTGPDQAHIMDAINNAIGYIQAGGHDNVKNALATIRQLEKYGYIDKEDVKTLTHQLGYKSDDIKKAVQQTPPEIDEPQAGENQGLAAIYSIPGGAEFTFKQLTGDQIVDLGNTINAAINSISGQTAMDMLMKAQKNYNIPPKLWTKLTDKVAEERKKLGKPMGPGPEDYDNGEPDTFPSNQQIQAATGNILQALSTGGYTAPHGTLAEKLMGLIKNALVAPTDPDADDVLRGQLEHYLGANGAYAAMEYISKAREKLFSGQPEEPAHQTQSKLTTGQVERATNDILDQLETQGLNVGSKHFSEIANLINQGLSTEGDPQNIPDWANSMQHMLNNDDLYAATLEAIYQAKQTVSKGETPVVNEPKEPETPTAGQLFKQAGMGDWLNTLDQESADYLIDATNKVLDAATPSDAEYFIKKLMKSIPNAFKHKKEFEHNLWVAWNQIQDKENPQEPAPQTVDDILGLMTSQHGLPQTLSKKLKPFINTYLNQNDPETRQDILNIFGNMNLTPEMNKALKQYLQQATGGPAAPTTSQQKTVNMAAEDLTHQVNALINNTISTKDFPMVVGHIKDALQTPDDNKATKIISQLNNLFPHSPFSFAAIGKIQDMVAKEREALHAQGGPLGQQMNAPEELPAPSGDLTTMMQEPDTENPSDVTVPGDEQDLVSSIADQIPWLQHLSPESHNKINKVLQTALEHGHNFSSIYDAINDQLEGNLTTGEMQKMAAALFKQKQQQMYQQTVQNPEQDAKEFAKAVGQQFIDANGYKLKNDEWQDLNAAVQAMFKSAATGDSDNAQTIAKELYDQNLLTDDQYQALVNQILPSYVTQQKTTPTSPPAAVPTQSVADVIKGLKLLSTAEKAANTSMHKPWSKGNPKTVLNWAAGKLKKQEGDPEYWKNLIMALVKNHGLDIGEVPQEYIPDDVKAKLANTTTAQEPLEPEEPTTTEPTSPVSTLATTTGEKPYEIPKNIEQKAQQYIQDYGNVDTALAAAQSLLDQNMNTDQREYYSQLVTALKDAQALEQRQKEKVTKKQEKEKEKEKEKLAKKLAKITPEDAENYVQGYLNSVGVHYSGLPQDAQDKLLDATMKALASDTEFGVYHAFAEVQKSHILDDTILDGLKVEILDTLQTKGKLDTSPEAFKKYFNYPEALNTFLQQNPEFAQGLSPADKQTMLKAMEHGMAISDVGKKGEEGYESGYQKAKKYYQDTLVGKIPGFDETVFQKFRNYLMQYHDQFKQIQDYEQQKKAAAEQKKKEAEELQKLLKSLQSGDMAGVTKSIAGAVGVANPTDQQKLQVGIAKALQAPTSQDMIDILNTLGGEGTSFSGYSGQYTISGIQPVDLPAGKLQLLKTLVASAYKKATGKSKKPIHEPSSPEPAQQRAAHVFHNWLKGHGMTLGYLPKGNTERQTLVNAVVQAISAPSADKADEILNSMLYPGTSLTDDQVDSLRKMVHQERQNPWALQKNKEPLPSITQHSPKMTTALHGSSVKSLGQDMGVVAKLKYYKVPTDKQPAVVDLLQSFMSQDISAWNQKTKAAILKQKFLMLGLPMETAKNLGNWAIRDTVQDGPASQAAKKIAASQGTGPSMSKVTAVPVGTKDQNAIKQFISNIPASQDPNNFVKNEWVKGEQLVLEQSLKYVASAPHNPNHDVAKSENHKAVQKNLSPENYKKYKSAASSWQGSGQWGKSAPVRKAVNDIFNKAINGPPPLMAKVDSYVERGMAVSPNDFVDFIKAFEIGKRVALPPSGFSYNRGTATTFGGHSSADSMHVLLRVRPNKNGNVKGAVLGYSHANEEEIVVGSGKDLRCTNVIKHVINNGYSTIAAYEIEMVYDDSLNESVDKDGLPSTMFAGLSPSTVKMIFKYLNTPVGQTPNGK